VKRAYVTGATGFIGRHLVNRLVETGWHVEGVVRSGSVPGLAQTHTTLPSGVSALRGFDTVFHLAGLAHNAAQGSNEAQLLSVNCDQTVSLFQAAQKAGVSRFIWLSSIKVLGDRSDHPLSTTDPLQPGDAYARSKAQAEGQLTKRVGESTQLCMVRPPLVYGVGVKANFLRMISMALSPWPLPLKGAIEPRAWLSVNNLVHLLLHIADSDLQPPTIVHARDDEQSNVAQMLSLLAAAAGQPLRLWHVKPELALMVTKLLGFGSAGERLFQPLQVDMQNCVDELAWTPAYVQKNEIDKVVKWFQQQQ